MDPDRNSSFAKHLSLDQREMLLAMLNIQVKGKIAKASGQAGFYEILEHKTQFEAAAKRGSITEKPGGSPAKCAPRGTLTSFQGSEHSPDFGLLGFHAGRQTELTERLHKVLARYLNLEVHIPGQMIGEKPEPQLEGQ